ncbi:hypothetical protein RN607_05045 [Demequina capsici]|uniref:Uncharacterized protein n=1 Tax=Demequina capsici TaxID=3075620 RepID=A0AA96FCJ8_9MICO|nr:hypothetical protein [Demequina sp. PMTSA13]WNM28371.1 hypothetical protein RN607_05045 [Demequina sp. PMTSA13]
MAFEARLAMSVRRVGADVSVRMNLLERIGGFFFGSAPSLHMTDVEWVAAVGRLHVDDATQFVRFSQLGSVNLSATWGYIDLHGRSNYDRGRAYVRVRYRKPAYVVKAQSGGSWTLLLFSSSQGAALLQEICAANPRVQVRDVQSVLPYRLHK